MFPGSSCRCRGCGAFEGFDVYPQLPVRAQRYQIPPEPQARGGGVSLATFEHLAGEVECAVEVVRLGLGVEIGPEHVHDPLPVQPVPRCEGEELDKTLRLAQTPRVTSDDSRSYGYFETTQQPDADGLTCTVRDATGTVVGVHRESMVRHPLFLLQESSHSRPHFLSSPSYPRA